MEPPRKANSDAATATGRPRIRPEPVITDSSSPVLSLAVASLAAYAGSCLASAGGVSQELNVPRSSRAASISRAPIAPGCQVLCATIMLPNRRASGS